MIYFRKAFLLFCTLTLFSALPGKSQTASFLITADFNPEASESISVTFGTTVPPHNNSMGTWFWDFGDGKTSTAATPTHVYDDAGAYTVTATFETARGVTSQTSTQVLLNNVLVEDDFNNLDASMSRWGFDVPDYFVDDSQGGLELSLSLIRGNTNQTAEDPGLTVDQNGGGETAQDLKSHYYEFEMDLTKAMLLVENEAVIIFELPDLDYSLDIRRFAGILEMRIAGPQGPGAWLQFPTGEEHGIFRISHEPANALLDVQWLSLIGTGEGVLQLTETVPTNNSSSAFIGFHFYDSLSGAFGHYGSILLDDVSIYRFGFPEAFRSQDP